MLFSSFYDQFWLPCIKFTLHFISELALRLIVIPKKYEQDIWKRLLTSENPRCKSQRNHFWKFWESNHVVLFSLSELKVCFALPILAHDHHLLHLWCIHTYRTWIDTYRTGIQLIASILAKGRSELSVRTLTRKHTYLYAQITTCIHTCIPGIESRYCATYSSAIYQFAPCTQNFAPPPQFRNIGARQILSNEHRRA